MNVDFQIDQKALTEFEHFMTRDLQREMKSAYARTLRLIGAGAVRTVIRELSKREGYETILKAGIEFSPRKVDRIEQLDPMRIAIGVNRTRRLIGEYPGAQSKPFIIRTLQTNVKGKQGWIRDENGFRKRAFPVKVKGLALAQRKTSERLPIHVIVSGRDLMKQMNTFKYMVDDYVGANHDKILGRQLNQIETRAQKRRK